MKKQRNLFGLLSRIIQQKLRWKNCGFLVFPFLCFFVLKVSVFGQEDLGRIPIPHRDTLLTDDLTLPTDPPLTTENPVPTDLNLGPDQFGYINNNEPSTLYFEIMELLGNPDSIVWEANGPGVPQILNQGEQRAGFLFPVIEGEYEIGVVVVFGTNRRTGRVHARILINEPPRVVLVDDFTVEGNPAIADPLIINASNLIVTLSDDGRPDPPNRIDVSWSGSGDSLPPGFENRSSREANLYFYSPGTYEISLEAYDRMLFGGDSVTITIKEAPVDPVVLLSLPETILIVVNEEYSSSLLDYLVEDVENPEAVTWEVEYENDTVQNSVDGENNLVLFTDNPDAVEGNVTVTATDENGNSESGTIPVIILPEGTILPEEGEFLALPENITIDEGESYTISLDDVIPGYDQSNGQATMSIESDNSDVRVVPDGEGGYVLSGIHDDWYGEATLTVTIVYDNGETETGSVPFVVNPVNDPPTLYSIPGQTIQWNAEFEPIILSGYATDPDLPDDTLTWSVQSDDPYFGVSIIETENGPTVVFDVIPDFWDGEATVTFTVTDSAGESASVTAVFKITGRNQPPRILPIIFHAIPVNGSILNFDLRPYVEDLDHESGHTWSVESHDPSITATITDGHILNIQHNGDLPADGLGGNLTITLTVTDPEGASSSASFPIVVIYSHLLTHQTDVNHIIPSRDPIFNFEDSPIVQDGAPQTNPEQLLLRYQYDDEPDWYLFGRQHFDRRHSRLLVRASDRSLWAVFNRKNSFGYAQIYIVNSSDDGQTWSEPTLISRPNAAAGIQPNSESWSPTISINSKDEMYVAWVHDPLRRRLGARRQVVGAFYNGTEWSLPQPVSNLKDFYQLSGISMEYDGDDVLHMAVSATRRGWIHPWSNERNQASEFRSVLYAHLTNNQWSEYEVVSDENDYSDNSFPRLAVDSQNKVHMVFHGFDGGEETENLSLLNRDYVIRIRSVTNGALGQLEEIKIEDPALDRAVAVVDFSVAVDLEDQLHIGFSDAFGRSGYFAYGQSIRYEPHFPNSIFSPSVFVDNNNNVHFMFFVKGYLSSGENGWYRWFRNGSAGPRDYILMDEDVLAYGVPRYSVHHNNGGVVGWLGYTTTTGGDVHELRYRYFPQILLPSSVASEDNPIQFSDDPLLALAAAAFGEANDLVPFGDPFVINGRQDGAEVPDGGVPFNVGVNNQAVAAAVGLNAAQGASLPEEMVVPRGAILFKKISDTSWDSVETLQADDSGVNAQLTRYVAYQFFVPTDHPMYFIDPNLDNGIHFDRRDIRTPDMVRDSQGKRWVVYEKSGGPLYIASSEPGSYQWHTEPLRFPAPTLFIGGMKSPSLAIDSNDQLHLVFCGNNGVFYSTYHGGEWSSIINIANMRNLFDEREWGPFYSPSLAIDGTDALHVAYAGPVSPGGVYYRKKEVGGQWSPAIDLANPIRFNGGSKEVSLAVGPDGVPYIVWTTVNMNVPGLPTDLWFAAVEPGQDVVPQLMYREPEQDQKSQGRPRIVMSERKAVIVWLKNYSAFYSSGKLMMKEQLFSQSPGSNRFRRSTSFRGIDPDSVGTNGAIPLGVSESGHWKVRGFSLALDDRGNTHILFHTTGVGDRTQTYKFVSHMVINQEGQQTEPVIAVGEHVNFSQLRYAYHHNNGGNLDWVWLKENDGELHYSLRYEKDSRYRLPTAITLAPPPSLHFDLDPQLLADILDFAEQHGLDIGGNPIFLNGRRDGRPIPGGGHRFNVGFRNPVGGFNIEKSLTSSSPEDLLVPRGSVLYRMISPKNWVPVEHQQADDQGITATLMTYSVYQFFVPIPDYPFVFGEVYTFPNPARRSEVPTLHVEVGMADVVRTRIYDAAGDLVFETRIDQAPVMVEGKPAYEYPLTSTSLVSGVYRGIVTAEKEGEETLRKTFTFSVLR